MANVYKAQITDINGGIATYEYSASENEYAYGYNINIDQNYASLGPGGNGPQTISPNYIRSVTNTTFSNEPLWMVNTPKRLSTGQNKYFIYDAKGSVYGFGESGSAYVTEIANLDTESGSARGNGCAYYDNYIYFARNTTIARYGPLGDQDGGPSMTTDYWVGTLGQPELNKYATEYLNTSYSQVHYPNHILHRHRGALYVADMVGGQGMVHKVKTTKTTVEGDTDDGSNSQVLDLPYGYRITDMESYGDDLVIAAVETDLYRSDSISDYGTGSEPRAALFFWDTVADSYYKQIQDEFPDQMITALENANGVLYSFSTGLASYEPNGCRVMRYLGGNSFEQITLQPYTTSPLPGGTESILNQVLFTGNITSPTGSYGEGVCTYSIGSQFQPLSNAVAVVSGSHGTYGTGLTLLKGEGAAWNNDIFYTYCNNGNYAMEAFGGSAELFDTDNKTNGAFQLANSEFDSKWFVVGNSFKIKKVRFYHDGDLSFGGFDLRVYIKVDRQNERYLVGYANVDTATNTYKVVLRPPNAITGEHSFQLIMEWYGLRMGSIALPIDIEYEIFDD